jgi:hypothetical protein
LGLHHVGYLYSALVDMGLSPISAQFVLICDTALAIITNFFTPLCTHPKDAISIVVKKIWFSNIIVHPSLVFPNQFPSFFQLGQEHVKIIEESNIVLPYKIIKSRGVW